MDNDCTTVCKLRETLDHPFVKWSDINHTRNSLRVNYFSTIALRCVKISASRLISKIICMNYDHNKKFGLLKFHSGYGNFYLNIYIHV